MSAALGVLAVLLLTAATGYFVAQEFSYVAVDRARLAAAAQQGDRRAARALGVTERLSFTLSGAQLGITATALLVGFIAEPALADLIRPLLQAGGLPGQAGVALTLALVLATVIQMVLGELAPKNLAIARPEAVARALASSTLAYLTVAGPIVRFFNGAANRLLRLLGIEPMEEPHQGATGEELARIIEESGKHGHLSPEVSQLLQRALAFGDRTAGDVMVPRPDVAAVRASEPVARVVELLRTKGFSRYPVVGENMDDIVGLVGVHQLLDAPDGATVGQVAHPALLVPATLPLPDLLGRMRERGETFACVLDEYGGLAGVVTLEDVAEELVGDIRDENDPDQPTATREPDGSWVIPGQWRLDEVQRATGVELPDGDYETIGGLVIAGLGRLPQVGDQITSPALDRDQPEQPVRADLIVEAVQRRVPALVRLVLVRSAAPPQAVERA